MHGLPIPNLKPGSPEWASKMSASKVGAMLGLSPFESRYALWQRMAGAIPWEADNDTLRRGHYLEQPLRNWWQDQNVALTVDNCGAYAHPDRPDLIASPDGLIKKRDLDRTVVAILECKTANNDWEWGAQDTDEVPPYYRAQALWQMYVTGVHTCHFSILTSFLEFRSYVVPYDADDAAWIVEQADQFMASIAAGTQPDIDASDHTYQAIRALHPLIDGTEVDLDPDVAAEWLHAQQQAAVAKRDLTLARNKVAHAMGTAAKARYATQIYATRQTRGGCPPFVVVGRGLVAKEESAVA